MTNNELMLNVQMTKKFKPSSFFRNWDIRHFCESYFRFSKTALLLMPVKLECSFRKS